VPTDLESLAERLGRPLPTRSLSRRHGHRPKAPDHVRRLVLVACHGVRPTHLARALGISRSTLYESLGAARQIAAANVVR
jgi:transcriptional regulator of acetoin/glycerol metabolism